MDTLVVNAHIITMAETETAPAEIERGYLAVTGGVIEAVGPMSDLPDAGGAETVDAGGSLLLPGFVDAHTHLGVWEDSLGFEGDDGNEDTDPVTPHLRIIDAINPMDRCFAEAREAGVTTVMVSPGSANPIAGQMAVMKTGGRQTAPRLDDWLVLAPAGMKFALGENPKASYHEKNQQPVTRMATAALIREQLQKARRYGEDVRRAETEGDLPEFDMKCEALLPVLEGRLKAHFHAHRADDIFTAIRIAEEFHLDYTIIHCTSGYLIADVLAAAGATALCGPLLCDRSKPELRDLTPAAPGILEKAGVRLAIVTDHPVVPIQYLPLTAALAVREGLSREAALRAITITPAELCGVSDRCGSLAPGKDADFSLFAGDPLALAKPWRVYIGGQPVAKS